jgi:hypothetical protein
MEQPALSVRAQYYQSESQSAFNVPGAIEYILEIQSPMNNLLLYKV